MLVLAHGHALYCGAGGAAPAEHLSREAGLSCPEGYNIADFLLEVASDPPVALLQCGQAKRTHELEVVLDEPGNGGGGELRGSEEDESKEARELVRLEKGTRVQESRQGRTTGRESYSACFLTQLEVLSGREWKILRR